jgi:hypothetical protein
VFLQRHVTCSLKSANPHLQPTSAFGSIALHHRLQVDALAPHVREAKHAVYLGKNPRDYTNKEKLLQVRLTPA